jgi:hypothetical protein
MVLLTRSWVTILRHGKETFPPSTFQMFDALVALQFSSESNMKNRNRFGQRRGKILPIWHGGRRGATPTFATVFHFTASKPRFFHQQLWSWKWSWYCGKSTATTLSVNIAPWSPKTYSAHFYWDPQREKKWRWTHNERDHSTLRYAAVLRENYFTGYGDESLLPPVLRQFWRRTFSPKSGDKRKCLRRRKVRRIWP